MIGDYKKDHFPQIGVLIFCSTITEGVVIVLAVYVC